MVARQHGSDSDEYYGGDGLDGLAQSFDPSTPPPSGPTFVRKRRKGIPHRAPMGLTIEY